jgi:hypothetical protein
VNCSDGLARATLFWPLECLAYLTERDFCETVFKKRRHIGSLHDWFDSRRDLPGVVCQFHQWDLTSSHMQARRLLYSAVI